jgi:S-sulfo-L-cysteine synthase (3-phospho-L-serine-dependent)
MLVYFAGVRGLRTLPKGAGLKTILVIESSLNGETFSTIEYALKNQMHPVFLTNDITRYASVPGALKQLRQAEVRQADTNSADSVVEVARGLPSLVAVMSLADFNTQVAAEAASELGLPGTSPDAVALARNKARARDTCRDKGLASPRYALCHSREDLRAALKQIGTPCVVKPVTDAAGHNVMLCRDYAEADAVFNAVLSEKVNVRGQAAYPGVLVEEYFIGCEVSVELVMDKGRRIFAGVTDKLTSPVPRFIELGHTHPSGLTADGQSQAIEFATAALAAIGYDYGPAHVELVLTADGPRLVEINPRLAGGGIPGLIEIATGVSLREAVLLHNAGLDTKFPPSPKQAASTRFLVSPAAGVVTGLHGMEAALSVGGVVEAQWHVRAGAPVAEPASNRDRVAHVVCRGATPYEAAWQAGVAINQLSVRVND